MTFHYQLNDLFRTYSATLFHHKETQSNGRTKVMDIFTGKQGLFAGYLPRNICTTTIVRWALIFYITTKCGLNKHKRHVLYDIWDPPKEREPDMEAIPQAGCSTDKL
jgi:hypothetical protein